MKRFKRSMVLGLTIISSVTILAGCTAPIVKNSHVPEPLKPVDLNRYAGKWYEFARYENRFEKNCEGATATYEARDDGLIDVSNACHRNGLAGPVSVAHARAEITSDTRSTKLKVSFFGPFFFGKYWVLDHADDYSWSIVGEPSGKFLWILTRAQKPSAELAAKLINRAVEMGYDESSIHRTQQ